MIRAEEKDHVYFDQNLDVLLFWLNQITLAKKFH